ncbi:flowering time control protein FPA isoform X1 [Lycium barbarum]|uniref:flowering time control protein FPA isoform X1 n=1 Tax=Lycium barbarum TaxID=112863 RepID=UPI00293EA5F1|nr:flowering time control protein FPA isoform X1 [Lycium barbarum]
MSTGRGGRERDRYRRDHPPRSEEKSHHGRENPPSRHLWVGNLSHSLSESTLANHFLRFGDLESVAFQPGRSYAFINFKDDEGAFAAIRHLQGYVVAGNPLRIEFTKAEKSSPAPPRDEEYFPCRDERPMKRRSPLSQRDSRTRHSTPDKSGEPSEVLWIGFPAQLKVDEFILRKAFSPFGPIDRITAFPGRTYAFVRYKNVMAACRAKETLQGKLFDNPRVHICFARSESGPSNKERSSMNDSPSSHLRSYGHIGSSENLRHDRDFGNVPGDHGMRSPRFNSDMDPGDSRLVSFGRKGNSWAGEDGTLDRRRYPVLDSELGHGDNAYNQRSPPRKRVVDMREFSPQRFPRQDPFYDDSWDLPEDPLVFHEAKKLKTSSYFPENELPEYPFNDMEPAKHRGYHEYSQAEVLDKNFDSGSLVHKRMMNSNIPYPEENDRWNSRFDGFKVGPGQLASNAEQKRLTPEPHPSSKSTEWKWEGTIAKGGTAVCRARCFPVGKPLDMILPVYLDCTARTSLDMLAKHYYQAAGSWVVFFVPATDADMAFYNEFMNYLGEKQRAAVAKLDDRTTMFLVPPSDFSEKVLKVPGKLSISGVVLRLEPQAEKNETSFTGFQGMTSFAKPISPSGPNPALTSYSTTQRPGISNMPFPGTDTVPPPASFSGSLQPAGNFSESFSGDRHNYMVNQQYPAMGQNWSSHDMQKPNPSVKNIRKDTTIGQGYNPSMPGTGQESSSIYSRGEVSSIHSTGDNRPPPASPFQSDQLAMLASSLLGQQRQSGVASTGQDSRQPGNAYLPDNSYRPTQQNLPLSNNQPVDQSSSQFSQIQQLLQQQQQQPMASLPGPPPRELQHGTHLNQLQNAADEETDPQKRLQATLQLAAALLHQIQQGKP